MKKLLIKNWRLKILALVSAVILWLFVIGIENTVSLFPREIEVEILNMNESVGISQSLPGIKVYVNADKEIIKNFLFCIICGVLFVVAWIGYIIFYFFVKMFIKRVRAEIDKSVKNVTKDEGIV